MRPKTHPFTQNYLPSWENNDQSLTWSVTSPSDQSQIVDGDIAHVVVANNSLQHNLVLVCCRHSNLSVAPFLKMIT